VSIERRDDPVPGRTYPYLLGGENAAPEDELIGSFNRRLERFMHKLHWVHTLMVLQNSR
jgi:hypothetical protein